MKLLSLSEFDPIDLIKSEKFRRVRQLNRFNPVQVSLGDELEVSQKCSGSMDPARWKIQVHFIFYTWDVKLSLAACTTEQLYRNEQSSLSNAVSRFPLLHPWK